jgi:hypothetical protein
LTVHITQIKALSRHPLEVSSFVPKDTLLRLRVQSRIPDVSLMPGALTQNMH